MRTGLFRCGVPGWSGEGGTMEKEKRTEVVYIRMTPDERVRLQKKMEEMGIKNIAAFSRKMVLDGYCVRLDVEDIKELIRLLRICSNNLNQYAKVANTTGSIYKGDILDLKVRLDDIWVFAKTIMKEMAAIK